MSVVLAGKGPAVFTIGPDQGVREAIQTLAANNIGALIVLDDRRFPTGILSERDIIRECARRDDTLHRSVGEIMTPEVTCGSPEDDVDAVLKTMTTGHFRHLPIVEDGQLVGMVTVGDLVKARMDQLEGAVETLQTQIMDS